jgi:hypothetical protein
VTFYDLQIRKEKQVTEKLLLFVILTNLLLQILYTCALFTRLFDHEQLAPANFIS